MSFYRQDDCDGWKWSKVSKFESSKSSQETDDLKFTYTNKPDGAKKNMTDLLFTKNILNWERVVLNPKLMIGGSLYRCPKCKNELFIPYGRSIRDHKYCNNCKEQLNTDVAN